MATNEISLLVHMDILPLMSRSKNMALTTISAQAATLKVTIVHVLSLKTSTILHTYNISIMNAGGVTILIMNTIRRLPAARYCMLVIRVIR